MQTFFIMGYNFKQKKILQLRGYRLSLYPLKVEYTQILHKLSYLSNH